jgi:hypothetical protein
VLGFIKAIPVFRLLLIAELAIVLRQHYLLLDKDERRRLRQLLVRGPRMTQTEREEMKRLLGKLRPRLLAGAAVEKLSPVPLPDRVTAAAERRALAATRSSAAG